MIRRIPIRWRLALAFAAGMALLFAGAGLFLRLSLANDLDQGVDRALRVRADDLAALVGRAGEGGLAALAARQGEEEGFAQVLDSSGRVIQASPPRLRASVLDAGALTLAGSGSYRADIRSPLEADERSRILARAVRTGAGPNGWRVLVVGASLEERDEAVGGLTTLLLIAGPVALALASALGYWLAGAALRPVEAMRRRAARVSGAERGARLPLPEARDELRRLGETLNAMLERIDGAMERERAFVADASHELRTPVAILRAEIDLALAGDRSAGELRAALVSAGEETERLARLAEDLLVLARAEGGRLPIRPEGVSAAELIEDATRPFRARASADGRAIRVAAAGDLQVSADRLRLEQALGNLLDNALRHGRGTITVLAERRDGGVDLAVADEGEGFAPAFADRAFERFSRAEPARGRGGAGLGLAIVRAVALAHGGEAEIDAAADGARVRIWLPANAAKAAGPRPSP